MIFPRYATFLHFRIFSQHCQQGWLLPCSRFSVSQNFCSSLKYLSRMYTFDVPIPAILTTGGHHWLSSALPICPALQASSAQIFPGASICFSVVSHPGDCYAGRPALDWLLTDGSDHGTAPRPNCGTMHQCTNAQCTRHRLVRTTLVHCGTTWVHVTRQPAVVGGSR